jgi:hypothetical protein
LLAERRRGWSLMIFCARATRGLRMVGGEQPDHPSCSQNAHDEAMLVRAVSKGQSGYSPYGQRRENQKAPPGLLTHLGVPVGARVRKLHAMEDQSAPIPKEKTSTLGGNLYFVRCAQ